MCVTYHLHFDDGNEELEGFAHQLGKKYGDGIREKYAGIDIYPKSRALVVGNGRKAALLKWGFPLPSSGRVVYNARSESLLGKPLFRRCSERRCLVPATFYYEWGRDHQKYRVELPEHPYFYMAALWDGFPDGQDKKQYCFTIITTPPNDAVSRIHDRMPAIIIPEDADRWLPGAEKPFALLKPYAGDVILRAAEA